MLSVMCVAIFRNSTTIADPHSWSTTTAELLHYSCHLIHKILCFISKLLQNLGTFTDPLPRKWPQSIPNHLPFYPQPLQPPLRHSHYLLKATSTPLSFFLQPANTIQSELDMLLWLQSLRREVGGFLRLWHVKGVGDTKVRSMRTTGFEIGALLSTTALYLLEQGSRRMEAGPFHTVRLSSALIIMNQEMRQPFQNTGSSLNNRYRPLLAIIWVVFRLVEL